MNLITLTTDFGLKDPFVGMMKGVIYSIKGSVNIVDITHSIEGQDILEGAFVIGYTYKFFPKDTIHVVVVDPGVGSGRRPILVVSSNHYFIGPDNGVFSMVISENPGTSVIEITEELYFFKGRGTASYIPTTFHGRDIFAPVAAWLSRGIAPSQFGHTISDYTRIDIPQIDKGDSMLIGKFRRELIGLGTD